MGSFVTGSMANDTWCCRLMWFLLLQTTLAAAMSLPYTDHAQILQQQAVSQLRLLAMHSQSVDRLYQHTCMKEAFRSSLNTTTWWKVCVIPCIPSHYTPPSQLPPLSPFFPLYGVGQRDSFGSRLLLCNMWLFLPALCYLHSQLMWLPPVQEHKNNCF